jgi:GrpB-like predicted nucleotidyltransferase (UPF0157 family)
MKPIDIYTIKAAELKLYDPDYVGAAGYVADLIKTQLPHVTVEHIGSTAIAGCDGKGIIDLMVLYPKDNLEVTKEVLRFLGFQNQPHRDQFPESRPMRVGSITYNQKVFQIHVHVIEQGCLEAVSTLRFRDKLRENHNLMQEYVQCKRQILQQGISDSLDYCRAKQDVINKVLTD